MVCVGWGTCGACVRCVFGVCGVGGRFGGVGGGGNGEKVSLAALLSGYLGKSGHLPRELDGMKQKKLLLTSSALNLD